MNKDRGKGREEDRGGYRWVQRKEWMVEAEEPERISKLTFAAKVHDSHVSTLTSHLIKTLCQNVQRKRRQQSDVSKFK